jgi:aryl-alcohol dehydrogenase-like predicted oxidoreductase
MKRAALGCTGLELPVLGLGCSQIASLSTRANGKLIARLLDQAYADGIRLFDTADIYGQGDSERRLGQVAARDGTVICTKAGLALTNSQPLVRLAKPILRPMLKRLKGARDQAARMRQRAEICDLGSLHLRTRLEGSLRRLKRDRVELFLLHSPPLHALADGRLYDLLDEFREIGLAQVTGVSCRTIDDAAVVISEGRAQAVQIPLDATSLSAAGPVLAAASRAGIGIIAREVLRPVRVGLMDSTAALSQLLTEPRIGVVLTGTTSRAHLNENIVLARAMRGID